MKDLFIGDWRNVTLLLAACSEVWEKIFNKKAFLNNKIEDYALSKKLSIFDSYTKDANFKETLSFYMICFAYPAVVRNWIKNVENDPSVKG